MTGTLTQNVMKFKRASCCGNIYGEPVSVPIDTTSPIDDAEHMDMDESGSLKARASYRQNVEGDRLPRTAPALQAEDVQSMMEVSPLAAAAHNKVSVTHTCHSDKCTHPHGRTGR